MDIAFILPTANSSEVIKKTIQQFRTIRHVQYEVIVSDNGSNDQTIIVARAGGARVIVLPESIPGTLNGCRNRGAAATSADLLWFCSPEIEIVDLESFADEVVNYFRTHPEAVALMPFIVHDSATQSWHSRLKTWYSNARYYTLNRLLKIGSAPEDCIIVRRSAFDQAQGFDPAVLINGHSDLAHRLTKLGEIRFIWHRRVIVPSLS